MAARFFGGWKTVEGAKPGWRVFQCLDPMVSVYTAILRTHGHGNKMQFIKRFSVLGV